MPQPTHHGDAPAVTATPEPSHGGGAITGSAPHEPPVDHGHVLEKPSSDMSRFLVHDDGPHSDLGAFHRNADNDLFTFGDVHGGHAAAHSGSWTQAIEMDLHGNTAATSHSAGWTHQVESHVVVIDNHQDNALTHISNNSGASGSSDPTHDHLDKVHW